MMKFVRSCRVYICPSQLFETDHHMIIMNVEFPSTRKQLQQRLVKPICEPALKTDFQALRDCVDIQQQLTVMLDKALQNIELIDR
jgi:hypothetical protein